MNRAERRTRTEKVIGRRLRISRAVNERTTPVAGHRYAKNDSLGSCGNRHCSICAYERADKRMTKRRERYEGKRLAG